MGEVATLMKENKKTILISLVLAIDESYSTTNKRYLAASCFRGEEITVGQNAVDSSKTGNEQL